MNTYKTYIDMREWYVELNKDALQFDNKVISINNYEVLLKTLIIFDTCKLYFIYDTKIDITKAFDESGDRYADEAYEVISKCRNDIQAELFNLFYKYKKS